MARPPRRRRPAPSRLPVCPGLAKTSVPQEDCDGPVDRRVGREGQDPAEVPRRRVEGARHRRARPDAARGSRGQRKRGYQGVLVEPTGRAARAPVGLDRARREGVLGHRRCVRARLPDLPRRRPGPRGRVNRVEPAPAPRRPGAHADPPGHLPGDHARRRPARGREPSPDRPGSGQRRADPQVPRSAGRLPSLEDRPVGPRRQGVDGPRADADARLRRRARARARGAPADPVLRAPGRGRGRPAPSTARPRPEGSPRCWLTAR